MYRWPNKATLLAIKGLVFGGPRSCLPGCERTNFFRPFAYFGGYYWTQRDPKGSTGTHSGSPNDSPCFGETQCFGNCFGTKWNGICSFLVPWVGEVEYFLEECSCSVIRHFLNFSSFVCWRVQVPKRLFQRYWRRHRYIRQQRLLGECWHKL